MKLNTLILSLLAIVTLNGCNNSNLGSTDSKPTANIATIPASSSSERFSFVRDRKFGYINRSGNIVIPARFDNAGDFSEGLASVKIGDKYGCIDSSGKVVIPPRFEYISEFKNGFAKIRLDGLENGKIDKTGKIVIAPSPPKTTSLSDDEPPQREDNGLTLIGEGGKYGYQDNSGKIVVPFKFDFAADSFFEDMAWVKVKDRIGYINKQGKKIVPPQFDYLGGDGTGNFDGGLARVCSNQKCGYIDKTGKIVIPLKFDDAAQKFRDGLAWVKIGDLLGYIDKTGKIIISAQYGVPSRLKAGREGDVGFCDGCKYWFSAASDFDRGLAFVEMPNKQCEIFNISKILNKGACNSYGYIDRSGKLIFKF